MYIFGFEFEFGFVWRAGEDREGLLSQTLFEAENGAEFLGMLDLERFVAEVISDVYSGFGEEMSRAWISVIAKAIFLGCT